MVSSVLLSSISVYQAFSLYQVSFTLFLNGTWVTAFCKRQSEEDLLLWSFHFILEHQRPHIGCGSPGHQNPHLTSHRSVLISRLKSKMWVGALLLPLFLWSCSALCQKIQYSQCPEMRAYISVLGFSTISPTAPHIHLISSERSANIFYKEPFL